MSEHLIKSVHSGYGNTVFRTPTFLKIVIIILDIYNQTALLSGLARSALENIFKNEFPLFDFNTEIDGAFSI